MVTFTSAYKMFSNKIYNIIPDATLICSIILAYLLNNFFPVAIIIPFPVNLFGWLLALLGFGFAIYIIAMLRSRHMSTDATGVPSDFIVNGFFALSRNPFYLAYVVVLVGVALALGSLAAFIAPLVCFMILDLLIIPLEEKNLQKRFGKKYQHYKHSVRRWL